MGNFLTTSSISIVKSSALFQTFKVSNLNGMYNSLR